MTAGSFDPNLPYHAPLRTIRTESRLFSPYPAVSSLLTLACTIAALVAIFFSLYSGVFGNHHLAVKIVCGYIAATLMGATLNGAIVSYKLMCKPNRNSEINKADGCLAIIMMIGAPLTVPYALIQRSCQKY